ncbi:TniQ family protein [Nostoc sp. DSM 114161]|jgi:transcriptional regulator with XRE-family HTH domain|uniref:TniQ family protein n=1 Tax=Nostoc sp. DSM 114161 TaxID=3440143 RepID=UPI004045B1F8
MLNKETLTIYKPLNLQKPAIPPRSDLYSLEPIGVGTPYIESLTSYITRLAEAHCVPTGRLISAVIISPYREEDLSNTKQKNTYNLIGSPQHHRALNGIGIIANRLIDALESLTLRSDLRFLTMATWSEVISNRSLFRPSRAWCPICYEEWRETGKLIYEPLIWGLELVKICPIHYQFLQILCPHCGKKLLSLEWHSRPGYCSKCQKWLGINSKLQFSINNVLSEEELFSQQSAIYNIKELITNAPEFLFPVNKERIKNFLTTLIKNFFNGNLQLFVNDIGISYVTVYKWYKGTTVPEISSILKISNFLGISLSDFLIKELNAVNFTSFTQKYKQKQLKRSYNIKSIDLIKMQQLLNKALNEYPPPTLQDLKLRLNIKLTKYFYQYFPTLTLEVLARHHQYKINNLEKRLLNFLIEQEKNNNPPYSITSIAIQLKISPKTLYKYFPNIYNDIAKKYIQYKIQILEKNRRHIREAVLELHNKGIKPNKFKVEKLIGNPKIFCNPINCLTLKEIWLELGYLELL